LFKENFKKIFIRLTLKFFGGKKNAINSVRYFVKEENLNLWGRVIALSKSQMQENRNGVLIQA
jgi:hypothetical protein